MYETPCAFFSMCKSLIHLFIDFSFAMEVGNHFVTRQNCLPFIFACGVVSGAKVVASLCYLGCNAALLGSF